MSRGIVAVGEGGWNGKVSRGLRKSTQMWSWVNTEW